MDSIIPLFPLNTVLFPGMLLPLSIFEGRYREMVRDCIESSSPFGVALIQMGPEVGGPALPYMVGTTARIAHLSQGQEGTLSLIGRGEERFKIEEILSQRSYLQAKVSPYTDSEDPSPEIPDLAHELATEFKRYLALLLTAKRHWTGDLELPTDPEAVSFFVSSRLNVPTLRKQQLLETTLLRRRLSEARDLLREELHHIEMRLASQLADGGNGVPPS